MTKTKYTVYGLIDPRTAELYYIGQTRRNLVERTDEHFFDGAETLVSKRNKAILTLGLVPGILKLGEAGDATAAFHAELHWIHFWTVQGKRLLNREAQPWFQERYQTLFSPQGGKKSPRQPATPPASSSTMRQGKPWTPEEDAALAERVRAHVTLPEIATHHQRSPYAITRRLAKLREAGTLRG